MQPEEICAAQFAQRDVLAVSKLDAATLQTWINRRLLDLGNPGTGKRRLYSALDIVRLAIMQRLTGFGVGVTRARDIAMDVTNALQDGGKVSDSLVFTVFPQHPAPRGLTIISATERPSRFGDFDTAGMIGDDHEITLAHLLGRSKHPDALEVLGGIHDTVLVVCVGRIVEAVLSKLEALGSADAGEGGDTAA